MRNIPDRYHAAPQNWRRPNSEVQTVAAPPKYGCDDLPYGWPLYLGQPQHLDQRWLHRTNRALVLTYIREYGPITRVKLAEMTALSRATVSTITSELLKEGAIQEGERLPSTARGGRRAILLHMITH
ncbi:MAG: MarR family transcriptional regulator [Ktedonobacterales bacterium]